MPPRLENSLPPPSSTEVDPAARIVDDLKTHFDKVLVDLEAQDKLKNQITQLEKKNMEIVSTNEIQTNQLKGLTSQIKELEQGLEATRGELEEKTRELDVLRANPPEDPVLNSKFRDLESQYNTAQQKVDAAAQDTAKDKQELTALRESIVRQEEQLEQLGLKIKSMDEDKAKEEEASRLANQKLREEFEKAQLDSKTTMQQEYQTELKRWEQRQAEVESALNRSREETQKAFGEHSKTRSEQDKFKGFVTEAEARLQHAEGQRPSLDESTRLRTQLQAAEEKFTATEGRLQSLSENLSKQDELNSQRYQDFVKQLNRVDQLERTNEALARQNLTLKDEVSVSRRQITQSQHIWSNATPTHPTPRKESAEQQEQFQPIRHQSRVAQRKPSTQSQHPRPVNHTDQASGDGGILASPQNMTAEKRFEKGVTFSNQTSYSETPAPTSSPMELFDSTGRINVRQFRSIQNGTAKGANGAPRSQEGIHSSRVFSQTAGAFPRNDNANRISRNTPNRESTNSNKGSSRTANAFGSRSKEREASHGQEKQLKSALKSRPQQTPGPESTYGNSTPNADKAHMAQAVNPTQNHYTRAAGQSSRGMAPVMARTAGTSSKIVAGKSATTHLGNQQVALDSPRQGSSRRYMNTQSIHGKRAAPPGIEIHAFKRRASTTRRVSQRSLSKTRIIPDSQ